mmetsp:Transcript_3838/g.5860  ORF Transcript_3838/g.5860 Transcript_3838/m.5860 type:complete len:125 (-) Transcript_3838:29-403(-)
MGLLLVLVLLAGVCSDFLTRKTFASSSVLCQGVAATPPLLRHPSPAGATQELLTSFVEDDEVNQVCHVPSVSSLVWLKALLIALEFLYLKLVCCSFKFMLDLAKTRFTGDKYRFSFTTVHTGNL